MTTPSTTSTKPRSRLKKMSFGCLGGTSLIVISFVALILTVPTPGDKKTPAGYTRNESRYLTMRDGVRIAIDLWYPADLAPNQRVPTIIRSTRYGRAYQLGYELKALRIFGLDPTLATEEGLNKAGYAVVLIDARGSGASFGSRPIEWSAAEMADLREVIAWIVAQPWSNGKVGAYGVSYDGNTAELAAATGHSALKAVAPQYSDFDPQVHLAIPGGVFNQGFIKAWSALNHGLDRNDLCGAYDVTGVKCLLSKLDFTGIKPVDEDTGGHEIAAAVADRNNADVFQAAQGITYRDDVFGLSGQTIGDVSPYSLRTQIENSGAAMYVWVSWLDAGTVDGALSRYLTFSNPQKLIIGPWSHGGEHQTDPFLPANTPPDPPVEQQLQMLVAFFDKQLKDNGEKPPERGITYYVLGAGVWKTTATWPPAGVSMQRWYFGADRLLTRAAPTGQAGADEYRVDFTASTGTANRWQTQLGGGDVVYPDRAAEDKKLLTYTSEPMQTDVEITGGPVVTLYVSSTETDGAFHVYLEDVAPDGRVTYITEGILRAIHRNVSSEVPPYTMLGPYHSFKRADGAPLVPEEVARVPVQLYTTSVLIHKGHRIRVSVAGHDASLFARYPAEGTPVLTIQHNRVYTSHIDLPVLERL
jgi:putative CocE/NonD family hydrolase